MLAQQPRRVAVPIFFLFLLCVVGCGKQDDAGKESLADGRLRIKMLDPDVPKTSLPDGCSFREVQVLFEDFLDGGNSRDESRLVRRVAPQPELNAFGVDGAGPEGSFSLLKSPESIYEFFANQSSLGYTRHLRFGEILPISPGSNPSSPFRRPADGPAADDAVISIGFTVDLKKDGEFLTAKTGKGGMNCTTGQIYVYNGG